MKQRRLAVSILAGAFLIGGYSIAPAQTAQSSTGSMQSGNAPSGPGTASGASSPHAGAAGSGADTATVTVPMLVLVPVEVQNNPQLNNGCWVRLVDKDAMPGKGSDILTIVGTMGMPSFQTPSGVNWSRKADSLTVGPNATVTVYSDKNYQGTVAKLSPGQQVKDLNKELGFAQSIDSLKVSCNA